MRYFCYTVGLVIITKVLVAESCPKNAVGNLFVCLANLTTGIHEGGRKFGEDSYIIKRICRTKEFQTATDCVESLFRECRHDNNIIYLLEKLANPQDILQAFDVLCANVELYVESSECMMKQDQFINPCSRQTEKNFDHSIAKSETVNQQISTFCGFQTGMRNCITGPVKSACGMDIGNLLFTFMKGVTSPVCNEVTSNGIGLMPVMSVLLLMMLFITQMLT